MLNLDTFQQYCRQLPGSEETYPFGDHAVWYKVAGKVYAWTFVKPFNFEGKTGHPFMFINVKGNPEKREALREAHMAIQPGWHQNKMHWHSVFMDGSLPDRLVLDLIDESYRLVVSGLPAKLRSAIKG